MYQRHQEEEDESHDRLSLIKFPNISEETGEPETTGLPPLASLKLPYKPYKILVLGEAGTGKSTFIESLYCTVSKTPRWFSPMEYETTKVEQTTFIPAINTKILEKKSTIDHIRDHSFGEVVSNFILKQHRDGKEKFKLVKECDSWDSNIPEAAYFHEMIISEWPSYAKTFPPNFAQEFDKIIIMTDYHDITTMRSAQFWAELIRAPKSKTIVCVNKCELEPISSDNDFASRKARVLKHFSEQCRLEFISVASNANMTFLYKYLEPDY
jgi:signal recognition particle receptor subunit beta